MKRISACLAAWMLVLSLGVAGPAHAVTYEDSFDQCNYPKGFDLMIMRPISFGAMVMGGALFTAIAPLAFATVPKEIGTVFDGLVASPARFTFKRSLGECTGVDLSY